MKDKLPPLDITLPEGYIVRRQPRYTGGIEYDILKVDPRYPLDLQESLGGFTALPSEFNENELIQMNSSIEPEIQRKGIARHIYRQAEIDSGKKIIPDMILSEMSAPLHRKYGLGNEFGLSSYEEVLKRGLERKANNYNTDYAGTIEKTFNDITGEYEAKEAPPLYPPEYAEKQYQRIVRMMRGSGLDKFKSIIPTMLKGAGVAGALAAPSADAAVMELIPGGVEELGADPEQKELDRRYSQRIRELQERKR